MNFNDLLTLKNISPDSVVALRHRPKEPALRNILPRLAGEHPEIYNAFQQTQGDIRLENALLDLRGRGYLASFIGENPKEALFVGLYKIESSVPWAPSDFTQCTAYQQLVAYGGMFWFTEERIRTGRPTIERFELIKSDFYSEWQGKLIIDWAGGERSWWRRAHRNDFKIKYIREESLLVPKPMPWNLISLTWAELKLLSDREKQIMGEWRGIYYIFDRLDRKGYVGSAYGSENIMGRWNSYAATGHGGNKLFRGRDPNNFQFSILQRVSPDMEQSEVVNIENSWKIRLNTRSPLGLNDN